MSNPFSRLTSFHCPQCFKKYEPGTIQTFATCCNQPLVADYGLHAGIKKDIINQSKLSLWRYAELLPVLDKSSVVSLAEGMTPLVSLQKLSDKYGLKTLVMKDESGNPTGSFKARGLSVAVSRAKELKISRCIIPTAGNAGGALAAYCANASMDCTVIMPRNTPGIFKEECELYGARVIVVEGMINDCAKKAMELNARHEYFDMSTMKEPGRLEGKKTMGYEIAEQYNWVLPDVIVYPAGGGTCGVGIWKAFLEMKQMGWIKEPLPRMIAVQSAQCNPIEFALQEGAHWKKNFKAKTSLAIGLVVPDPFAMDMIKNVLQDSHGQVCSISEEDIKSGIKEMAAEEGILISPEGATAWKAIPAMIEKKWISPEENILFLNTGSAYKYMNNNIDEFNI